MTISTCIYCGATKFGALTKCAKCGQRPENGDDIMASLARIDPRHLAISEKIVGLIEESVRAKERANVLYATSAIGLAIAVGLAWYWS